MLRSREDSWTRPTRDVSVSTYLYFLHDHPCVPSNPRLSFHPPSRTGPRKTTWGSPSPDSGVREKDTLDWESPGSRPWSLRPLLGLGPFVSCSNKRAKWEIRPQTQNKIKESKPSYFSLSYFLLTPKPFSVVKRSLGQQQNTKHQERPNPGPTSPFLTSTFSCFQDEQL